MNIQEARVLITGGGRGIGRHLVESFLKAGAKVGVFEKDPGLGDLMRTELPACSGVWTCDVTDPEIVDGAVAKAEAEGFAPNVLINNAGIIHSEPLINLLSKTDRIHSRQNWRRVISADLDSVFFVTGSIVERMVARREKGVVISISSISAGGNAGQSAYSAAKAGVNALTRTWSKELGPLGIRFAAVAPGFLDTPSTRSALSESMIARIQGAIPLRRLGDTESIYQAARQIIENEYLTGTVLEIDGGMTI